jgi:hypothetical protein
MYHQNVGRYNWNIVESGAKHHKPKPPQNVGSKVNLKWRMLQNQQILPYSQFTSNILTLLLYCSGDIVLISVKVCGL